MKKDEGRLKHLAIIMDGNRRWARQHAAEALYTQKSAQAIFETIASCKKNGIARLSLYAFSLENSASRDEVLKKQLFDALIEMAHEKKDFFIREQVRVTFVGERAQYPRAVCSAVEELEQATAAQTGLQLFVLFYYGGRQEIVCAARSLARDVASGVVDLASVDETLFEHYLLPGADIFPDLIIRTGGNKRLSNFLLYQAAYSELMFLDCLWPEITECAIDECINQYFLISRNFGS